MVNQESFMALEQARMHTVAKPWGCTDLRPWNGYHDTRAAIGEACFERADPAAPLPALQLKLIFSSRTPAIERAKGRCEAWYVLSATADARIAIGLQQHLATAQSSACLRADSRIDRTRWQEARVGYSGFVPSGTLHAIGAGLVIAEIHRRTEQTLPLFGDGLDRQLNIAMTVPEACARQSGRPTYPRKLGPARTLLVAGSSFVLERMTLAPGVTRELEAAAETWLFILAGTVRADSLDVGVGNALFVEGERVRMQVGAHGLRCLVAYARSVPAPYLLRRVNSMCAPDPARGSARASLR